MVSVSLTDACCIESLETLRATFICLYLELEILFQVNLKKYKKRVYIYKLILRTFKNYHYFLMCHLYATVRIYYNTRLVSAN